MKERRFWTAAAALLALLGAIQFAAARNDSATFDEPIHMAAGYSYLLSRDFRLNPEHPPLAKQLFALPLLLLRPDFPFQSPAWKRGEQLPLAFAFLYDNRVPAGTMLLVSRSVAILMTLLLGASLALWTKRRFGAPAALLALFLFTTDPNIAAHGRLATTDLPVTLFFWLAVTAWGGYVVEKRPRDLVLAGLATGLALLSKFSAALLLPVFAILYLCRAWQEGEAPPLAKSLSVERFFASMLAVALLCALLILPVYGMRMHAPLPLSMTVDAETDSGRALATLARAVHLPDHPFLAGLFLVAQHAAMGHSAYLLGQLSTTGWWRYYPVAFLVKTPTAVLLLLACSLAALVAAAMPSRLRRLRELPFCWLVLAVPVMTYFGAAMATSLNIGLRHLLPIYPFLFVFAAAAALRAAARLGRARPYLLAGVILIQTVEAASIYPHHLSFFNTVCGGPGRGARYLLDSNLDWGQDLIRLKRRLEENGAGRVCLSYFGFAPPSYYGIHASILPGTAEVEASGEPDCLAAVSVTLLNGVYGDPDRLAWLRRRQPSDRIGYSIYLYDLRRNRASSESGTAPRRPLQPPR